MTAVADTPLQLSPPTVRDFCSDSLVHGFGDLWNPPGLTNFLGCAQVDLDPVAIRSVSFPPYAMGEVATGNLFLDDRLFTALGVPVATTWRPDRVVREAEWDGLAVRTTTVVPFGHMAVLVRLEVTNTGADPRQVPVRLALRAGVTRQQVRWSEPAPPGEEDNDLELDPARPAMVWTARHSNAVVVQGGVPGADSCDVHGLRWSPVIVAGGTWVASYLLTIGADAEEALASYDALAVDVEQLPERCRGE